MKSLLFSLLAQSLKKPASFQNFLRPHLLWYTTNAVTKPFDEDIPFVIVSHAVQKAYVVQTMRTMPRVLDMYCWLTKTTMSGEIPSQFNNWVPSQDTLGNFSDFLLQNQKKFVRNKDRDRFTDEEVLFGMLYGLFQHGLCEVRSNVDPSEYYIDLKPKIKTHWLRSYDYFQYEHCPGLVLRGKKPLPTLPECFTLDENSELRPGPYDSYAMQMFRHNTIKLQNWPGYFNVKHNPYQFVHTLFLPTRVTSRPPNLVAAGLISCFAHLQSEAQSRGELFGTQLEQPTVAQCIATDGIDIAFVVFKLRTLSLQDDRGIWNQAWSAGPFQLCLDAEGEKAKLANHDLKFVDYLMNMLSRSLVH